MEPPRMIIEPESPYHNERPGDGEVSLFVVYSMGEFIRRGDRNIAAADWLFELGVSAHNIISPDGTIHQYIDWEARAWHAGVSEWEGRNSVNDFSIGVELLVAGIHDWNSFVRALQEPHPYTDKQYSSLGWLFAQTQSTTNIGLADVAGHDSVAGDAVRGEGKGKIDPGPNFDWARFYELRDRWLDVVV